MAGEKLEHAKRLGIFYNELFSKLSKDHEYIRMSMYSFADDIQPLVRFGEEWDPEKEGPSKVKLRFIKDMDIRGGTNMLPALQIARDDIAEEKKKIPAFCVCFDIGG